jgi:hypothetical protein
MEVSAEVILHPARWSVRPSGMAFTGRQQDAAELVRSCKACQFHAKQIHTPAQALQMIPPSWPFAVWGLDIFGPFPTAVGGYSYLYVAIDKFTKWPEATPVVYITKASATAFLKSIVCRFVVPNRVITDNGTQVHKPILSRVLRGHWHPALFHLSGASQEQLPSRAG